MPESYQQTIDAALGDAGLQSAVYASTGRLIAKRQEVVSAGVLPDYQELRDQANAVKRHTLENLDYYLERFEAQVNARGGRVVWARDGDDVVRFLLELFREKSARRVVKSKSMTTEEIELNARLEREELEVVETDLGEYIVQLARQRPFHIVAPALHLTRYDVADLFADKLGIEREVEIEKQTMIARRVLREKFLAADIGISGANFVIAESGAVVLVTNEGNGRLTTTLPKIHVAIAGIEKLLPRAQDLATFVKLLGRSATGQPLTVYTSFIAGPRREGEIDGPDEFYVVLLDNGRTRLLADRAKRQSLYCIRCGACLNHCPVYRKIGGHSYPWVYSGPIGAVITPQYQGLARDGWLPFASSLCGACAEVCPVKIELPKLLLSLRSEVVKTRSAERRNLFERLAFRVWAWVMRHPGVYEMMGSAASTVAGDGNIPAPFRRGPLRAWLSGRDLPPMPRRSFRQMWRARRQG